jgi:putative peptide zinc metalloprotease protein
MRRHIVQAKTQLGYTHVAMEQARKLLKENALPQDHYREAERQYVVAGEELGKAEATKRERLALGTLEAESELAKREKELRDEHAALNLLEAGSRPEEIEAERARLARIEAEKTFLQRQQDKLNLISPVSGVVVTPLLRERIGSYFTEGELICEIENPERLAIDVPIEEQDVRRVQQELPVLLKPRALPLQTCAAEVERVAPAANPGRLQSNITVYCKLKQEVPELLPGMTGYARIYTGRTSIAGYLGGRALRYFRTEIWW